MDPLPFLVTHGALVWTSAALLMLLAGLVGAHVFARASTRRDRRAARKRLGTPTNLPTPGPVTLDGSLVVATTVKTPLLPRLRAACVAMVRDAREEAATKLGETPSLLRGSTSIRIRGNAIMVVGSKEELIHSLKNPRAEALGIRGPVEPLTIMSIPSGADVRVTGTLCSASEPDTDASTYREATARLELVGTPDKPIRIGAKRTRVAPSRRHRLLSVLAASGVFLACFVVVPEFVWNRAHASSITSESSAVLLCATPFHRARGLRLLEQRWENVSTRDELERLVALRSLDDPCAKSVGEAYRARGLFAEARTFASQCNDDALHVQLDISTGDWNAASERADANDLFQDWANHHREVDRARHAVGLVHLLGDDPTRAFHVPDVPDLCAARTQMRRDHELTSSERNTRCFLAHLDRGPERTRAFGATPENATPDSRAVRGLMTRTDGTIARINLDVPRAGNGSCPMPRGALGLEFKVLDGLLQRAPIDPRNPDLVVRERGLIAELAARRAAFEHIARRPEEAEMWAGVALMYATHTIETTPQTVGHIQTTVEAPAIHALAEQIRRGPVIATTSIEAALERGDESSLRALLRVQPLPFHASAAIDQASDKTERMAEIVRFSAARPPQFSSFQEQMCDVSARLGLAEAAGDTATATTLATQLEMLRETLSRRDIAVLLWAFRPLLADPLAAVESF